MNKIYSYLSLVLCTLNTKWVIAVILFLFVNNQSWSQDVIVANGPGNTYEELTAFLAPGHDPIEVPDCNHASFGNHIDEVYDTSIGGYAYRFIHVTPDNDRCIDEIDDRQRNEIKTYHPSPSNLKGTQGRMSYINGHLNFLPAFNLHLSLHIYINSNQSEVIFKACRCIH